MADKDSGEIYVLVIGAAGIDSKGRADAPLTLGSSTPGQVRVSVGGVARNVADNLTRLGVETQLLSAIGRDGSGQRILNHAEQIGINTECCLISEEQHTAAYLAVLDEGGNLVMSVDDMHIMSSITPKVIQGQRGRIKDAAMVVIDSNLSQATIDSLFKVSTRYNIPVCADPTSTRLAVKLEPHLKQIYMITPNIAEAETLTGVTIKDENDAMTAARRLVNKGVKLAMITLATADTVYPDLSLELLYDSLVI